MALCLQQELQQKLDECRPLLEILNTQGPHLASLASGEAGSRVDDLLNKDNKKFSAIDEQVQRRADKIHLQRQKSMEVCVSVNIKLSFLWHYECLQPLVLPYTEAID